MRSSLLALALLLGAPAFAQDTSAGDVPPKDVKAEPKADKDVVKANVEEDELAVPARFPFTAGPSPTLSHRGT